MPAVRVQIALEKTRQTVQGFGGNFARGRFGDTEPNDAVGKYTLTHLNVKHARIGLPLEKWAPQPGGYRLEGVCQGVFLLMQEMARRNIPITLSLWEAPAWLVENPAVNQKKRLKRAQWGATIEALLQFLLTAKERYEASVEHLSFNEPDGGYNLHFTPTELSAFIKQAGARFLDKGVMTKWLVGDTADATGLLTYAKTLLNDPLAAAYLGPIAFHSWDAPRTADALYAEIAVLGKTHNKPIWCTELGYDPNLHRTPSVFSTWDHALLLARTYVKVLLHAQATRVDYWTYQGDYPLLHKDGKSAYPALYVVQQFGDALPPGTRLLETTSSELTVQVLAGRPPQSGVNLLLLNTGETVSATLSGLPKGATGALTRSREGEGMAEITDATPTGTLRVGSVGTLTVPLPARSLTTLRLTR